MRQKQPEQNKKGFVWNKRGKLLKRRESGKSRRLRKLKGLDWKRKQKLKPKD